MPGGPCAPGAAAVEALEDRLLLAGGEPGPAVAHLDRRRAARERRPSCRRRVAQRVLDQRVERAVERRRAAHQRRRGARPASTTRARARARAPSQRAAAPRRRVGRGRPARPERVGARPRWQSTSSSSTICGEAVDLGASPASSSARAASRRAPARASSSRRRRPVSGVRSWCEASATNVALAPRARAEPVGHVVERARERALLGAALDRRARVEVARRRRARGRVEAAQRAARSGRAITAPARRPSSEHDRADERRARRSSGATRAVDGRDALRDAHRARDRRSVRAAIGTAVARMLLAERVAAALAPGRAAAQRRGDLGAVRVVAPSATGPAQSASSAPLRVDARSRARARCAADARELPQPARARRREQVGGGGGDDVGLAARLRAHLGVDAVAQAEARAAPRARRSPAAARRRAPAAGACAGLRAQLLVGAAKRKPTPRTVWM